MLRIGKLIAPAWMLVLVATFSLFVPRAEAQLDDIFAFGAPDDALAQQEIVQLQAVFTAPAGEEPATLYVVADMQPGWHIYSLTQKRGGPIATAISLEDSDQVKLAGPWQAIPQPASKLLPELYQDLAIESHEDRVVWQAPLELAPNVDPASLQLKTTVKVQACNDQSCLPPKNYPLVAQLGEKPKLPQEKDPQQQPASGERPQSAAAEPAEPPVLGTWDVAGSHTSIRGEISPSVAVPGGKVHIRLSAIPSGDYHVYAWAPLPSSEISSKPAMIVLDEPRGTESPWEISAPIADAPVRESQDSPPYYAGPVTWTIELMVPEDAEPGSQVTVAGLLGYQSCSDRTCDRPLGTRFEFLLPIDNQAVPTAAPLAFTKASYNDAALAASEFNDANMARTLASIDQISPINLGEQGLAGLPMMLLLAFFGGVILNLMPCVLPVVGLKILAFVQQSGDNRGRVLWLNLWYSLGLISVFLILAALASVYSMAWGQQFGDAKFVIIMAAVVFAMGLSFLGVWEIPIPGFAMSSTANTVADQEGPLGAFLKGVLTTLLATPCTGPLMGTALSWALAQPPVYIFVVFSCIGLGMASPYLLIGAFPRLIRFLPKPGMWMETFKHLMGFVLLATVVYLLATLPQISQESIVPTVALLFGIWAACWWIGQTPLTADLGARMRAWIGGVAFLLVVAGFSFSYLHDVVAARHGKTIEREIARRMEGGAPQVVHAEGSELPWQTYTEKKFLSLLDGGHTVMVDFTADWCLNCKTLEATVLNTAPTKELVEQGRVIPLQADMTNWSEAEGRQLLSQLIGSSGQIPVLAIFPADRPKQPIVFNEMYRRETLLAALKEAGPSKPQGVQDAQTADAAGLSGTRTALSESSTAGR